MTILADPGVDRRRAAPPAWVIGVDTHTDTHDAVLIDALGAVLAQTRVETTPAGHAQLQAWARTLIPAGQRMFWAIEGSRSHGHGLTRHLQSAGHRVTEAAKPATARRRRMGKSDVLDATHAALTALTTDRDPRARHAEPRADGTREALRMLLVTRRHDTDMRTATVNLFKSLLLGAGELRETLRGLSTTRQVHTVTGLPDDPATIWKPRSGFRACAAPPPPSATWTRPSPLTTSNSTRSSSTYAPACWNCPASARSPPRS